MACAQGPVELTEKDAGQVVSACVGAEVQIALKSNATTGFQWHFVLDPPTADVKVLKESYVPDDHPAGMVGTGGKNVYHVQFLSPGTTKILARHYRPWEDFHPETDRQFEFTVMVE